MYDHTFLNLQITRSDIRPHIKWAVSLVIAYDNFVWVNIVIDHSRRFVALKLVQVDNNTILPLHQYRYFIACSILSSTKDNHILNRVS